LVGLWRGDFLVASWLVAKLPGGEMTGYPFKHGPVVCQNVVLPVMNLAPLALKQLEGKQLTKIWCRLQLIMPRDYDSLSKLSSQCFCPTDNL